MHTTDGSQRIPHAHVGARSSQPDRETGAIQAIRRGTAIRADPDEPHWRTCSRARDAIIESCGAEGLDGVVCQEAAARIHGARAMSETRTIHLVTSWKPGGLRRRPSPRNPGRVSSRDASRGERRRLLEARPIVRHHMPLDDRDVVDLSGLRVTGLERTILDCARFLQPDRALAVVDSLFAVAVGADEHPWDHRHRIETACAELRRRLLSRLEEWTGQRGYRRAQAVVLAATAMSQSVWESEARRLCLASGLTPPQVQIPVRGADGRVYFADLGWLLVRLLLEIDGEVKLAEDPDGELRRRAVREGAIRDVGFDMLRLSPEDLRDTRAAVRRIWDALPPSARDAPPITALLTTHERESGGLRPGVR
ncbi:hypothetical protein [Actinomyces gaoshouyii]|uniref:DUF559 domain-containing protein n=1 Tax=Actinomyces gaoshouyii TaxID=1960083 RepID=A0A8H9LEG6_9ACTO|nr:hypothetical protein [Actinomyces gaoshouyii]GGO96420.1 hypothetical protein GCM10011612_06580 [Actinomyces gaoshouyii]